VLKVPLFSIYTLNILYISLKTDIRFGIFFVLFHQLTRVSFPTSVMDFIKFRYICALEIVTKFALVTTFLRLKKYFFFLYLYVILLPGFYLHKFDLYLSVSSRLRVTFYLWVLHTLEGLKLLEK
jgi:hypothetical protein